MSSVVAESGADHAVERLVEMCADLRSCAIVGADGELLAASTANDWAEQVQEIWKVVEDGGAAPAGQVHIATEAGELFLARSRGITAVALTDRFALASLMFCDLRAVLRDLEPVGGAG